MFEIKYYDYGPYGDSSEPEFGKEKTDNDVEAMKALDEAALSVDFDTIRNQVAALQKQSGRRRQDDTQSAQPAPLLRREPLPQPVLQPDETEQVRRGEYWDTYFSEDSQKVSAAEEVSAMDLSAQDDTYYAVSDLEFFSDTENAYDAPKEPEAEKGKGTLLSFFSKRKADAQPKAAVMAAQTEEVLVAPKQISRVKKYGAIGALSVAAVIVIGMVVVAEPWVPAPVDNYEAPQPVALGAPVTLEVGQTYTLDVTCGENEAVHEVYSEENDILSVVDTDVVAHGEWDSVKVFIKTIEQEIPVAPQKEFKLFGKDLSAPYNSLRSNLRAFFGIEPKTLPRTEKRVVSFYEQEFRVSGYKTVEVAAPINLYTQDYYEMTILHADSEEVVFTYEGAVIEVEKTVPNDEGYITYHARSADTTGKGTIIATTGFYKDNVFVPTGAMTFAVEVLSRPAVGEQVVFTSGNYNGNIIIEQGDGTGQS